jgi:hypothetical protein
MTDLGLRPLLLFTVLLAWCRPAAAQWRVSVEVGADRFWGGSIETTPDQRSFRPYRPTVVGLGLERRMTSVGIGVRLRYVDAAIALVGEGAAVAVNGVFDIYGISPEITYRLARVGGNNELLVHAGPLIEAWSIIDEGTDVHLGVQGGLSLRVPLGGRFAGSLTLGGAVSPSPFKPEQLEQNYEPRTLWRRGVAGRLEYRL